MPDDDAGGWIRALALEELPEGTLKGVFLEGRAVALANVDGDVYALEDQCSHQDFPLSDGELSGTRVECIYHGAKFDVCDGRAVQLPAIRPVKTYEVEVRDGDIFLQMD
jgi:3-phenylpropionate/trans-cinnamate dioxygenase ferredoxin subunit